MAAEKKRERLQKLIECDICMDELEDPRLLACRHTLCYKCVKDYVEKNNYGDKLPCPVCRQITDLGQGGVDNLPDFFFMNNLKEVILTEDDDDGVSDDQTQEKGDAVCSTKACTNSVVKYCDHGCRFMCQQCYDDHQSIGITKSHTVISVSEGRTLVKPKLPLNPPCDRHKQQQLDFYCSTCNLPVCVTCSETIHISHHCTELDKVIPMCKRKLEKISERTDWLLQRIKQARDKTKSQIQHAEDDIDDMIDNVKSSFKLRHQKLDKEENQILLKLYKASKRVKNTSDVITDSQMMTLAGVESLKTCQNKLTDKCSVYDYVSITDSIQKDIDSYYYKDLPCMLWKTQRVSNQISYPAVDNVEVRQSSDLRTTKGEISRIRLQNQEKYVIGMVVYKQCVYAVHSDDHVVYKYNPNGSPGSSYKHADGKGTEFEGICLIMDGGSAMLVVSDYSNKALVWIRIRDGGKMKHHYTQQLDYRPSGLYSDREKLMVCNTNKSKIHWYKCDGHEIDVTTLVKDIGPTCVTRHGDGDNYVVTDWENHQVVIIGKTGQVKKRYRDEMQGVKLSEPYNIMTDQQGRMLICDDANNNVLLMTKEGDEVRQLLQKQHVRFPFSICLDFEQRKLYVSGEDKKKVRRVFIYDYTCLHEGKLLTENITTWELTTEN